MMANRRVGYDKELRSLLPQRINCSHYSDSSLFDRLYHWGNSTLSNELRVFAQANQFVLLASEVRKVRHEAPS